MGPALSSMAVEDGERAGGGVLACRAWIISCVATKSSTWERVTGSGENKSIRTVGRGEGVGTTEGVGLGLSVAGGARVGQRGAEGVGALGAHLRVLHAFLLGRVKKGPDCPAPSLPVRTSRRNMNITRFPFATGQRGCKSMRALRTSDVWNVGSNLTQVKLPWSSFWADRTLAIR